MSPSTNRFRLSLAAAAIQAVVLSQGARAETQDTAGGERLEEVLVTGSYTVREDIDMATGLGLAPLETPQSVSIMTAQRLRDQDLETIKEVVDNAVGVSSDEVDDVRHTFYSRGFEIKNYQIDGVPMAWSLAGDSGETIADMAVYEQVEVVRGATGLLTGAGDPSASINLVRKHADSAEFEGSVDVGFGSWDQRRITADVTSGLNGSGSLRGRLVVKGEEAESYVDLYQDSKSVYYGVLEADLTDNTLLRLGGNYQKNDPTAPTWGALPTWFSDGTRTDWSRSATTAANWTRWETTAKNYFANLNHRFSNGWQIVANFNRLENSQETRLLYIYGNVDRDTGLGLVSWPYRSQGTAVQDSFDLQLKGDFTLAEREHQFVVGALRSEQTADTITFDEQAYPAVGNFYEWDGTMDEPGWAANGSTEVDLDTEQEGIYAASRLNLTDKLKAIVGGRLASWDRRGINYGEEMDFGDDDILIPYAGALYDLTDNHRLYLSYTEIFLPQNARDINGNYLDPLTGKSSEFGLKSSYMEGALQTTFALFLIEQDNLAQATGEPIPGTITEASRAVDGTESRGFESEVVGEIARGWKIGAGYTQFQAEDGEGVKVNTDHPRKLFKLFTSYRFTGALDGLTIGGGVNWQDRIYSPIVNPATGEAAELEQDGYSLISLMGRYAYTDNLSLQVNVNNALDETYYSQVGFFDQYRYGDPRNVSASVNYRF